MIDIIKVPKPILKKNFQINKSITNAILPLNVYGENKCNVFRDAIYACMSVNISIKP